MSIDYVRFERYVNRCQEVASTPGMNPVVVAVYNDSFKTPGTVYLTAVAKVSSATIAFEKENKEALAALAALDGPYRVARSAVKSVHPETLKALPETLKSVSTDTAKKSAIEKLLDIVDDYPDESWAKAVLEGEFGTKAPGVIKEINEAISANTSLTDAEMERAAAYGPAYERYISFKRVVRDALGASSKHYRRIHMRALPGSAAEEEATPGEATPGEAKPEGSTPEEPKKPS